MKIGNAFYHNLKSKIKKKKQKRKEKENKKRKKVYFHLLNFQEKKIFKWKLESTL